MMGRSCLRTQCYNSVLVRNLFALTLCFLTIGSMSNVSLASDSSQVVLGKIGNRDISLDDYNLFIRFNLPHMKEANLNPSHEELIEIFATHLVLAASVEANEERLTDQSDVKWRLRELKTREAYSGILEEEMLVKESLPEEKLRDYYNGNLEKFSREATYSFRNIFLDATRTSNAAARGELKTKAMKAREELKQFEDPNGIVPLNDFVRVAEELMGVPAKQINPRGSFKIGQINPVLEKAARSLDIGQVGDVIETDNGFYILRLESQVEGGLQPFEEAKAQIAEHFRYQIQKERFDKLRQPLLDPSRVEIYEEGLANLVRWASNPNDAKNVVLAETGDFELSLLDYIEYLKYSRSAPLPVSTQSPEEIRESHSAAVYNHVLYPAITYEEAVAKGYTESATFQERLRIGRGAILGEEIFLQLLRRHLDTMGSISEEEIRAYYEVHPEEFVTTPTSRYREIAIRPTEATSPYEKEFAFRAAEAKALEVLEMIKSGGAEERVIMEYSDGEEAREGGLTPWLSPGRRFSANVWEELETLEVGEWTNEPYRERGKAILLKLEDLIPSEPEPLESCRDGIGMTLLKRRMIEATQTLRQMILSEHGYEIDLDILQTLPPLGEE